MKKPKPNATPLSGTNGQLMVMAAHRYCLGRRTYIVGACIEWLRTYWPLVAAGTRSVIICDTAQAIERDEAGMDMDKRAWQRFVEWTEEQEGK